jgi:hypothetical protein
MIKSTPELHLTVANPSLVTNAKGAGIRFDVHIDHGTTRLFTVPGFRYMNGRILSPAKILGGKFIDVAQTTKEGRGVLEKMVREVRSFFPEVEWGEEKKIAEG